MGDDTHISQPPCDRTPANCLPNRGNHGASASVRLAVGESITLHVVIYNQSHVGFRRGLQRGAARLKQLQYLPARAKLRQAHNEWWREYWNASCWAAVSC